MPKANCQVPERSFHYRFVTEEKLGMIVLRQGSTWAQFLVQIHIIEEISQEHRICQVYNIVVCKTVTIDNS